MLLDFVISNEDIICSMKCLNPLASSDCSTIIFEVDTRVEYTKKYYSKYNYSGGDYDAVNEDLDMEWDLLLSPYENEVKSMWRFVKRKIISCVAKYILKVEDFNIFRDKNQSQPVDADLQDHIGSYGYGLGTWRPG